MRPQCAFFSMLLTSQLRESEKPIIRTRHGNIGIIRQMKLVQLLLCVLYRRNKLVTVVVVCMYVCCEQKSRLGISILDIHDYMHYHQ